MARLPKALNLDILRDLMRFVAMVVGFWCGWAVGLLGSTVLLAALSVVWHDAPWGVILVAIGVLQGLSVIAAIMLTRRVRSGPRTKSWAYGFAAGAVFVVLFFTGAG